MNSNQPILVTGGAGYIGSHAVLALTEAGWPVTVDDDLSTGNRGQVPDGVEFVEKDVGDLYQRCKILTRKGFPFWTGCDSRLAKEICHVSMHCSSGRL